MAKLNSMPTEIVTHISRHLPTNDLSSLRLTCKQLEAAVFQPFVREFFFKKQFMLAEPSLQALIDISEHPQLGAELRHLVIGLDHYDFGYNRTYASDHRQLEYVAGASSQMALLLLQGRLQHTLARAFARLPRLETVDIRDFRSPSRFRDGAAWSSLGANTVLNRTGKRLYIAPSGHDESRWLLLAHMPSIAFSAVVSALASAGRTGVAIEVLLRSPRWSLADWAFTLSPVASAETTTLIQGLKKLHLDLNAQDYYGLPPLISTAVGADGTRFEWLTHSATQTFLSRAENLTWLRLNFSMQTVYAQSLLEWVALPPSIPTPTPFVAPLQQLDIGFVESRPEILLALFTRFKDTLQAFGIWRVGLRVPGEEFRDKEEWKNGWASLFRGLARRLPHLREVTVGNLQVINADQLAAPKKKVAFRDGPDSPEAISSHYRGDNAADHLTALVASLARGKVGFHDDSEVDSDFDLEDMIFGDQETGDDDDESMADDDEFVDDD